MLIGQSSELAVDKWGKKQNLSCFPRAGGKGKNFRSY